MASHARLLTAAWLTAVRRRALRRHVWFKIVTKMERDIVALTIRCVDRVRSAKLALIIGRIACKVLNTVRSRFLKWVEEAGYNRAEKRSTIAVAWGYDAASAWRTEPGFIRGLGVNHVNDLAGWR